MAKCNLFIPPTHSFQKSPVPELNQYNTISSHTKLEIMCVLFALLFFSQAEKHRSNNQFFQTSFGIKKQEIYLVSFDTQRICSLIAAHSLPWTPREYHSNTSVYQIVTFSPSFPGQSDSLCWCFSKAIREAKEKNIKLLFSSFQSTKIWRVWCRGMQWIETQNKLEKARGEIAVDLPVIVWNRIIGKEAKLRIFTVKANISSMSSHTQATVERPGVLTYRMCS